MFIESFKFFDPPTTKWRAFKFFAKLNGNHILVANFFKLRKYQTFALIELHNLSKCQLADRIFKLLKNYSSYLRLPSSRTYIFWNSDILIFPTFERVLSKFYEKTSRFLNNFENVDIFLPLHQYLWSKISRQWNNCPLNFFETCTEEPFASYFVKWGKY